MITVRGVRKSLLEGVTLKLISSRGAGVLETKAYGKDTGVRESFSESRNGEKAESRRRGKSRLAVSTRVR